MSLDVYLRAPTPSPPGTGIFISENGDTREITWAEWEERCPGWTLVDFKPDGREARRETYTASLSDDLRLMAAEAGISVALWHPQTLGITKAGHLVIPLHTGLMRLHAEPDRFRPFEADTGWARYETLLRFVEGYLEACRQVPDADVEVSR